MGFHIYANDSENDSSNFQNIYVIVTKDDIKITTRNIKTPLSYIRDIFIDEEVTKRILAKGRPVDPTIVSRMKKQLGEGDTFSLGPGGNYETLHGAGLAPASFHFMLNVENSSMHLVDHYLSKDLSDGDRTRYFDAILPKAKEYAKEQFSLDDVRLSNNLVPSFDYDIFRITEFPGIVNYVNRSGINAPLNEDEFVILLNMKSKRVKDMIEDQLADEYNGQDCVINYSPLVYHEPSGASFSVDPPFYLVDFSNMNIFAATRSLARLILDKYIIDKYSDADPDDIDATSEDGFKYLAGSFTMDIDVGLSVGEVMNREIRSCVNGLPCLSNSIRSSFVNGKIDYYSEYATSYGQNNLKSFVRAIFTSTTAMSRTNFADRYGEYYYVCRIVPERDPRNIMGERKWNQLSDEEKYALNDINRRNELFNNIFTVYQNSNEKNGGFVKSESGDYYCCLTSYYSIPMHCIELFGYEPIRVYSYFPEAKVMLYSKDHEREFNIGLFEYARRIREFPQGEDIFTSLVRPAVKIHHKDENLQSIIHHSTQGIVGTLEDYPMVFSIVKKMFDDVGAEYRPIPVTLTYEPDSPAFGGYIDMNGRGIRIDTEQLFSGGMSLTDPPSISINTARIQDMESIAETLVHEAGHYLDDICEQQGIIDKRLMIPPKQGNGNNMVWLRSYLQESPTEFRSHARQLLPILEGLGEEYVRKNKNSLLIRIMNRFTGPDQDTFHNFLTEDASQGDETIRVSNPERIQLGKEYNVVEQCDLSNFYNSMGESSSIITVKFHSLDHSDGTLSLEEPLPKDLSVSRGAALIDTVTDLGFDIREQYELYHNVIKASIDNFLEGKDLYLPEETVSPSV
jgi:hypothetical protein